jgi:uncharacterized protein (TIGR02996 family)
MSELLRPILPTPWRPHESDELEEVEEEPEGRWAFEDWRQQRELASWTELVGWWQRVLDRPDDNTLRLVFADWLEEQGELPWAELIRLQLAADPALHARVQELTEVVLRGPLKFCAVHDQKSIDVWTGKKTWASPVYQLRRGTIERVEFLPNYMFGCFYYGEAIPEWSALREHPVRELVIGLCDWDGDPLGAYDHLHFLVGEALRALNEEPAIARIEALAFGTDGLASLADALSGDRWRRLRQLEIRTTVAYVGDPQLLGYASDVVQAMEEYLTALIAARPRLPSLQTVVVPIREPDDSEEELEAERELSGRIEEWRAALPDLELVFPREPFREE